MTNLSKLIALFPGVKGKRFDDLVADIKAHGLVEPIVRCTWQNATIVLDGRARERACKLAHVAPRYVAFESLGLKCTPEQYLWSVNLERRHLTADQRVVLAFEWSEVLKGEAKERQLAALNKGTAHGIKSGDGKPNATRREIAKRAFTTTHKVQQMETVKKHAPRLVKKVASGKIKLRDAAKIANRRRPKVVSISRAHRTAFKGITVTVAVKKVMATFIADLKPIAERVVDKRDFYQRIEADVSEYCCRMEKKLAA